MFKIILMVIGIFALAVIILLTFVSVICLIKFSPKEIEDITRES